MALTRMVPCGLRIIAPVVFVVVAARPTAAQQPIDPNPGNVTVTGAVDFTNAYMFRGIRQDDTKVIIQPYLDLGLALYSGDSGLKSVGFNVGTWNSLHTGDTGYDSDSTGFGCGCGKIWYESDFYATLGFGLGPTTLSSTYTAYNSPNSAFSTVKEFSFKFAVDDSGALGRAAMKPYALVAVEFDTSPGQGQADGGLNAGRYLEIGIAPGWAGSNAGIAFPVKVGLSLQDYYEIGDVDNKFGFLSGAAIVTIPLGGTSSFGAWNIHGGVEVQALGDTTKVFNNGDAQKVIGSVGLGFTY
jgi:Bacterial protein of unknown function (Gcw_chp)